MADPTNLKQPVSGHAADRWRGRHTCALIINCVCCGVVWCAGWQRCGWCERPCWSRVSGRRIHPHCNVRRLEAVHDRTGSAREKQSRDAAPAAAAPAAAAAAASVTGAATATATVAAAASASPARTEPCVAAASGLLSLSSPAPWPLPAIAAPHATAATAATAAAAGGLAVATPAEAASGEPEENEYQRYGRVRRAGTVCLRLAHASSPYCRFLSLLPLLRVRLERRAGVSCLRTSSMPGSACSRMVLPSCPASALSSEESTCAAWPPGFTRGD